MAVKPQRIIPLPPKTAATLRDLVTSQRTLQAQIDAIVNTARDLLNVPDDYMITDIGAGFVPPPVQADQAPAD